MKNALKALVLVLSFGIAPLAQANLTCTIRAYDGHFLTAVGGGGRVNDVIHTDAVRAAAWERFTLVEIRESGPMSTMKYAIRTVNGNYLTAVGGGGRVNDVIHSDAVNVNDWEKFSFVPLGNGVYGIRTVLGYYLTAQDSGGRVTDVIHSNATQLNNWEKFRINCRR